MPIGRRDLCRHSIRADVYIILDLGESESCDIYCISPNVGRYYGLVTGPPPAMEATMEAMEAEATMAMEAATERF